MARTITLSPVEYAETKSNVAKINARAAKRGFTGRFTVEGVERMVVKNQNGMRTERRVFDVTLDGEAPCYNGWEFVAALDWDANAGLITRCAPGAGDVVIDREALVQGGCDHCKTNRARSNTYLVRNVETGEQVQVGSTCVKDFTGWEGRFAFISEEQVVAEIEGGFSGFGGEPDYSTLTVLAVAWAAIKAYGFVPASSWDAMPTKAVVATFLNPKMTNKADAEIVAALQPFVADAFEMATKVREYVLSEDFGGSSEYVVNLKAVAGAEYASARNIGLLASAPQALARFEQTSLVRKAAEEKPSEHFGLVGEKIEFTGTIETVRFIEGDYGTTVLYQIRNAESGNVVKWFASRAALGDQTGVEVSIKGTIKGHDTYNTLKTTVLTRCKAL